MIKDEMSQDDMRDDAEFDAFLRGEGPLARQLQALDQPGPSAKLDAAILADARAALAAPPASGVTQSANDGAIVPAPAAADAPLLERAANRMAGVPVARTPQPPAVNNGAPAVPIARDTLALIGKAAAVQPGAAGNVERNLQADQLPPAVAAAAPASPVSTAAVSTAAASTPAASTAAEPAAALARDTAVLDSALAALARAQAQQAANDAATSAPTSRRGHPMAMDWRWRIPAGIAATVLVGLVARESFESDKAGITSDASVTSEQVVQEVARAQSADPVPPSPLPSLPSPTPAAEPLAPAAAPVAPPMTAQSANRPAQPQAPRHASDKERTQAAERIKPAVPAPAPASSAPVTARAPAMAPPPPPPPPPAPSPSVSAPSAPVVAPASVAAPEAAPSPAPTAPPARVESAPVSRGVSGGFLHSRSSPAPTAANVVQPSVPKRSPAADSGSTEKVTVSGRRNTVNASASTVPAPISDLALENDAAASTANAVSRGQAGAPAAKAAMDDARSSQPLQLKFSDPQASSPTPRHVAPAPDGSAQAPTATAPEMLESIELLLESGQYAAAQSVWEALRARYPSYPIPDATREKLQRRR